MCLGILSRRTLVVRPKANLQTPGTRWRPGWNHALYNICEEVVGRRIPEAKDWLLGARACWLAKLVKIRGLGVWNWSGVVKVSCTGLALLREVECPRVRYSKARSSLLV